jgi:alpha-N-arabinofuranosidase
VVNTIAPLKTRREALLKEATYHAFVMYSQNAAGVALNPARVDAPRIATKRFGDVKALDVAATVDEAGRSAAVFLVHRGQTETLMTEVAFQGPKVPSRVSAAQQIWGLEPKAANTWDRPEVVVPRTVAPMPFKDAKFPIKLPPLSLTMVRLEL